MVSLCWPQTGVSGVSVFDLLHFIIGNIKSCIAWILLAPVGKQSTGLDHLIYSGVLGFLDLLDFSELRFGPDLCGFYFGFWWLFFYSVFNYSFISDPCKFYFSVEH